MKRVLNLLLLVLLVTSFAAPAHAANKQQTKKGKTRNAHEQTFDSQSPMKEGPHIEPEQKAAENPSITVPKPPPVKTGPPVELHLTKANGRRFDVRTLPRRAPVPRERNEPQPPDHIPATIQTGPSTIVPDSVRNLQPIVNAPAPPPNNVFEGLDRLNWGAGSPPDTNGDVGPSHYIQTVNTSIGIYRKSDGFQEAAFTFDTFMSQGNFGNLCDTNNFGDPVVLYDSFEDRWVITDFAFLVNGSGNPITPAYQCFAVSMNGDPVSGGWNYYSIQISDFLNDYPKFGVWTDGIYMSANLFGFGGGSGAGARVWAFNKAQMYAGSPTVKIVSFNVPGSDFTVIPSNARLQTGTPPAGRPNLFASTWQFLNALTVYKFHVDWTNISLSTFTGPDTPLAATSWPNAALPAIPQSGTSQTLDNLQIRAMVQNQYTNFGGVESLWVPHSVRRQNTTGFAAPRWYQVDVTGGTVAANLPQAATWDPDGANVMHRWMPSLALDHAGNMALGYSTSSSSTFPSISYAGRLAADPINTFSLTEQTFFTGTASQLSSNRWGDYSSMTLDPDGCTFWYTTEYATGLDNTTVDPTSFNKRWKTKFGNFGPFPGCTPLGAGGTVSGTVTVTPGGAPIAGASVSLGSRSTTADGSGVYTFSGIPAGTYSSVSASSPGYVTSSASNIVVTDGNTTTQNLALSAASQSSCLTDTTQADFLTGVLTNTEVNSSPGDVKLNNPDFVDQQNSTLGTSGVGITITTWGGQTFTPATTGKLTKVDINLFCSGCTGTTPNLTLSVRATSGGLPTGADLASATITGFSSGASAYYTGTFGSPITVTAGTQYALVIRPTANPSPGTYALTRSGTSTAGSDVYAGGTRVAGATSGTVWSIPLTGGVSTDAGFRIYLNVGYLPSGNFVSSPKDSNPNPGLSTVWSTLSWNVTVPANTNVKFQLAGSNNVNGPFNFVGPDGTAATFFTTSPAQLSPQFFNVRYLEYKAILTTTDGTVTPAVNDVTLCYTDTDCSGTLATITPTPASVCASSTGNTAAGPAGMTSYSWSITNGTITSATNIQSITYTAGASGTVTLNLTILAPNGCIVSGSTPVTINQPPPKPTITGTATFCPGFTTTLTSDAGSGNQWYLDGNPIGGATNQTYDAGTAGSYTVQVTDGNGCVSPMSDPVSVTQSTPPPVPTISGDTNGTGTQDQACPEVPLTLHANGATGAVSYTWYKDIDVISGETSSSTAVTGSATYYVTATDANGCTTAKSAGYVVQNPTPHAPFISFRGQASSVTTLAICAGSSQIIDSDSATGIHWWKDGVDLGPGSQSLTVTTAGVYTAQLNALGCHSQFGRDVTVTVTPIPSAPTVTPGGPTTFCAGGSVTLTSSSASGNQWLLNGSPIGGATNQTYNATAAGNYTATVTTSGCTSPASNTVSVTVNPIPSAPSITGNSSFCAGGSTTLTSSSASGNQWYLNGNPIGGATNNTYVATAGGSYTVTVTTSGCTSAQSTAKVVSVNPNPDATITAPASVPTGSTGNTASVANAGAGATYNWGITNGTITGGTGTNSITFTAGGPGTLTLNVTVTTGAGCSDAKSANVTVTQMTVTNVTPPNGPYFGGQPVTVTGTGFNTGATVTFGGAAATSVVVQNSTTIKCKTPAHAPGAVNVTVTNTDTTSATLNNAYTYRPQQFDPNGDNMLDPSDIFFLVNYLYLNGHPPIGSAGMMSGDANGDGSVDPADIFYAVNYLFGSGPQPAAQPGHVASTSAEQLNGALTLGQPRFNNGRFVIPVIVTMASGSDAPQSIALRARIDGNATVRRAGAAEGLNALFETSKQSDEAISYLVSFDAKTPLVLGSDGSAVVAEIELAPRTRGAIELDPALSMLANGDGTVAATVRNGKLLLHGTTIGSNARTKGTNEE